MPLSMILAIITVFVLIAFVAMCYNIAKLRDSRSKTSTEVARECDTADAVATAAALNATTTAALTTTTIAVGISTSMF